MEWNKFVQLKSNTMLVRDALKTFCFTLLALGITAANGQSNQKTMQTMEQRLTFITLGAKDMNALKQFYIEKFGWTPIKTDGIVFFKMNGFILSIFPADELAEDAGVSKAVSYTHLTLPTILLV